MCILWPEAQVVVGTRLFARRVAADRQMLVYSMDLASRDPVAMVLPIPVARPTGDGAVSFVDLSAHRGFFDALDRPFPQIASFEMGAAAGGVEPARLVVHQVGDFDASYVPSHADWERLDSRFRVPPAVWANIPEYASWGFVVFQFRATSGAAPDHVHPMAFSFPTRDPERLYFPTLHIHDGEVHGKALYDHGLYFQQPSPHGLSVADECTVFDVRDLRETYSSGLTSAADPWAADPLVAETGATVAEFMREDEIPEGVLDPDLPVTRMQVRNVLVNGDVWLAPV